MPIPEGWKKTIDDGISNAKWDEYDARIKQIIGRYNNRFKLKVNWLIIKAMLWIESGGPSNPAWKTRPMQIGNPGDPAYDVVKKEKEGMSEIMVVDPNLRDALKAGKINTSDVNIRAGIAYLFKRMAKFEEKSVRDEKDFKIYEYKVRGGDSLWSIAQHRGTTVEELRNSNPKATANIHAGQILKYRKAKFKLLIVGWFNFKDTSEIARNYNGGGDTLYTEKLDYILKNVFPKLKR